MLTHSMGANGIEITSQIFRIHQRAPEMFKVINFIEALVLKYSDETFDTITLKEENYPNEDISLHGSCSENASAVIDETFLRILDRLTGISGISLKLEIVAVVGVRGIGKTTLAKKLFADPFTMHCFHIRAWITVSERSTVREISLGILSSVAHNLDDTCKRSNGQLCEKLFRSLRGQRYLIVIDNTWSTEVWNDIKRTFPDDRNGSRVLLTSRLMNLAVRIDYSGSPNDHMQFLGIEDNLKNICEELLAEEHAPRELVKIWNRIAQDNQGLLLAIVLSAGILCRTIGTPNCWMRIAERLHLFPSNLSEQSVDILTLSYNHLPPFLRTCFFYIGELSDNCEIFLYVVIRIWMAAELLKPERLKSWEGMVLEHLEGIAAGRLLKSRKRSSDGTVKSSFIHDLFWELNSKEDQSRSLLI